MPRMATGSKQLSHCTEKVYVNGDVAELIGATNLKERLRASTHADDGTLNALLNDEADRPLSFRTTVIRSNDFKRTVTDRGYPDAIAAIYQSRQMSRFRLGRGAHKPS